MDNNCNHKFRAVEDAYNFLKIDHWVCNRCDLEITPDNISEILNNYANINDWLKERTD